MRLFHQTDIALEPLDDRDDLEKAIHIRDDFYIPSSSKGKVKLIYEDLGEVYDLKAGDIVYFDPRMMIEIKELNLVIVDEKALLMKVADRKGL